MSSAQNTTAGTSYIKVYAASSQRNFDIKPAMLTANNTGKNFAGIEEIPDENSVIVKNEAAASVSAGRWSSDMADETMTVNLSHRDQQPMASAFND